MDNIEREPGYDEIWYIFQVLAIKLGPKGQFYLREKNNLKFIVSGAIVKYPRPWREEWVMVGGDWGHSIHIDGTEYPVLTQLND